MNCVYEHEYIRICKNILNNGYYAQNRTGIPTYKLPHQVIQFDMEKDDFPILKSKFVGFKTAIDEMLWIMQGHNNVNELHSHIWDQWASEDGSIGKSYGYQIKLFDQVNKVIEKLKTDPQDRRMIIDLWNIKDLPEMNLQPCCIQTLFDVNDGRLNCMLIQRSADMPVGVPFDIVEYTTLALIIAKLSGLKPGLFSHIINNAHIYENQCENMSRQIFNYNLLCAAADNNSVPPENFTAYDRFRKIALSKPEIELNIGDTFNDIKREDISLKNYEYVEKIKFEVAK